MNISTTDKRKIKSAYSKFSPIYKTLWNKQSDKQKLDIDERIRQLRAYEALSVANPPIILLFHLPSSSALYISESISQLGYTPKDIYDMHSMFMFLGINWRHWSYPLLAMHWDLNFIKASPKKLLKEEYINQYGGLKLNVRNGKPIKTLMTAHNTFSDENYKFPTLTLCIFENISHLMTEDFYWGRYICGKQKQFSRFYKSPNLKRQSTDLVSDRELDVLRLITKNYTSKEIATELFISQNTVDKHRKNMLARSGARDTTALLEICNRCGITIH